METGTKTCGPIPGGLILTRTHLLDYPKGIHPTFESGYGTNRGSERVPALNPAKWPWAFQNPNRLAPSEHPKPTTKIGSKMGGAPTPKWDPIGFEPWPMKTQRVTTVRFHSFCREKLEVALLMGPHCSDPDLNETHGIK